MQSQTIPASLLTPIGYQNSGCGYCHKNSGSQSRKRFSYYASTSSLHPDFYQDLVDRGWRRSGSHLYKPDQRASCCPQYTIRLATESFHASKDQRQVLNRFTKHILGDSYIKEAARLHPRSREQARKRNSEFDLLERVHECEADTVKTPPKPAHNFKVTLEPDNFTEEKYSLFENYQRLVHHEPPNKISKRGFKSFLCDSDISRETNTSDGQSRRLGSYHQCYRIDGKLVAVGVLDLLPHCVSAVYFMYDESVHHHGFGKLGALREIALAKEQGYRWWYAGFYIHSCVKMRYKGEYTPQYILDPESYNWDPLTDEVKKKLDENKYLSLSSAQRQVATKENTIIPLADANAGEDTNMDNIEDTEDDDDDNALVQPNPNTQLYTRLMPGIMTREQIVNGVDLDNIKIRVRNDEAVTSDLFGWASGDMDDAGSIKGIVVELVSAVGPKCAKSMVVHFG